MQSILPFQHAGKTRRSQPNCCPFSWVGQSEDDRKSALNGEVDWKDGLLQGGELWPRKSTVGYYPSYEGLKDLSS